MMLMLEGIVVVVVVVEKLTGQSHCYENQVPRSNFSIVRIHRIENLHWHNPGLFFVFCPFLIPNSIIQTKQA